MKSKKLKKLARLIYDEVDNQRRINDSKLIVKESESGAGYVYCEYDEEVSDKFFTFINNILRLKSHLQIDVNDSSINIYGDLSRSYSNYSSNKTIQEDNIEVRIDSKGFRIRRNYNNYISYLDSNILEKLKPCLLQKNKIISKEIINDIIDDIMVKTNLSRENNLDELLK